MKIMLVGDWNWDIYEKVLSNGFQELGLTVIPVKMSDYLEESLFSKIQIKLKVGLYTKSIEKKFIYKVEQSKPDSIFFFRPLHFTPSLIKKLKKKYKKIILISYHNDNPFIHKMKFFRFKFYLKSLKFFDINYVYRPENIKHAEMYNGKKNKILMPSYIKELHDLRENIPKVHDVIFIGHYENDGRGEFCEYLIKNNINLKLVGRDWDKHPFFKNYPVDPPITDMRDYQLEIRKAKIALVFLSKHNNDVYTRRNFEIPATGTFMLSIRTRELMKLFDEGRECDFFSTKEELLKKCSYYLAENNLRIEVAENGRDRCITGRHSNYDRAKQILDDIKTLNREEVKRL